MLSYRPPSLRCLGAEKMAVRGGEEGGDTVDTTHNVDVPGHRGLLVHTVGRVWAGGGGGRVRWVRLLSGVGGRLHPATASSSPAAAQHSPHSNHQRNMQHNQTTSPDMADS